MVDFGTALSVAQTLFAALDCSLIKEACSGLDYESELERLKTTVTTVKSVLIDAGKKAELSQTDLDYIQKLKDAVYDADDLFDKFLTIAARKQNDSRSDKVRLFFSSQNPFKVAHSLFRDVKKIRDHLDAIADDRTKFGFSVDTQPLRRRREDTCSYVYANDVIGRDGDATTIINRLLDPTDDVGFLTIVGIGGLGKTTLAKLVYGDKRIEFPLRLWVCVADQDGTRFDVKEILSKILDLVGCHVDTNSTTEKVQTEYQNKIRGNKILLVLDDIWTENVLEWRKLREFLVIGGKGSRIIVTTRSKETAKIVGNGIDTNTHELQGLSEEDSWRLFEMTAFEKGSKHPKFVEIGKKILTKCHHLPLAIKVVGSLLYDHSIDRWQEFEINGFTGIPNGENEVISILKFSYDHLHPSLKSCFTYCAIFPKDFVIEKEMLLSLWEAQGYIVPFDKGQSIVKAGEEHFSILVKRCFFHDIKKNDYGEVVSFKIHDLMHDLAQRVSESEISIINSSMLSLKSSTRHVFETEVNVYETNCFVDSKIRSYLKDDRGNFTSISMGKILKNWVCLRALSLKYLKITSLPDTIGSLIHLRYLNLAESSIKTLPNSIVKLHNLRTLNLNKCTLLEELPKKFSKLVNLTHLYIYESGLKYMPVGMSKLSGLQVLNAFVIREESRSDRQLVGQLRDLKALALNLKGSIHILFPEQFTCVVGYDWEESFLVDAEHLKEVQISFLWDTIHDNYKEEIMKRLQPHSNLREFKLDFYDKETIKCWGTAEDNWATILPNLVRIELNYCDELQQLPLLSELLHLKHLVLRSLWSLKYMEEVKSIKGLGSSRSSELTFFPSLESLEIRFCDKLKGWWRDDNSSTCWQPAFPRLSRLSISSCRELTSFPACPSLHTLEMSGNNRALRITTDKGQSSPSYPLLLSSDEKSGSNQDFVNTNGGRFEVDHIDHLKLIASHLLREICISFSEMESLSEVEETFQSFSSLNSLEIFFCSELTSVRGGLDHLTALKSLRLSTCDVLKLEEGEPDDNNGMPWRALQNNLLSLKLVDLPKVEKLPMGMQYLTSLQHLEIGSCDNLKALPEWVGCFQSLQSLHILSCHAITSLPDAMAKLTSLQILDILHCHRGLIERCTEPNGQDWPKIKHIPLIKARLSLHRAERTNQLMSSLRHRRSELRHCRSELARILSQL